MRERSSQEEFWAGQFGEEYIKRNGLDTILAADIAMWSHILHHCECPPESAFEMGCNIGANLCALRQLLPSIQLSAVEINATAAAQAMQNVDAAVCNCSIMEYPAGDKKYDLVFSSGVMIHINPDFLPEIYTKLYTLSSRYVLINEYYNTTPVTVVYRGNKDKLFKRDFAGEMMDMFPDLKLRAYKFIYHRDAIFPRGDCTWFLLEKKS